MDLVTHLTQPYMKKGMAAYGGLLQVSQRRIPGCLHYWSGQTIRRVDKRQRIHRGNRWMRLPAYPPYIGCTGEPGE